MSDADRTIAILMKIVPSLGMLLGDKCEVVLHDLRAPESSIIAIVNGQITGRKVGDPSTNLGLPVFENPYGDYDKYNYRAQTRTGKILKCSSLYFKDETGRVCAALCLNYDISELLTAENILKDFVATEAAVDETFATDIGEVISKILEDTIIAANKPVTQMDKDERLKLIQALDEKGIFSVKRSIDRVASILGVSRATVYGYVNEIQATSKSPLL